MFNQIKLLSSKYLIPIANLIKQILGKNSFQKSHNLTWRNAENSTQPNPQHNLNQSNTTLNRQNSTANPSLNWREEKSTLNWRNADSSTLANSSEQNSIANSGQNSILGQNSNQTPNIPNTNIPPLIWLDQNNIDSRANRVAVPNSRQFFGKNVDLWQQSDSNQCGVCSLLNVFEVCGVQTNLNNIAAIRAKVLRNRINQGELKIENGVYYKEVQSSRRENRRNGWERITDNNFAETFWLSTTDVREILRQTLENNPSFKYGGIGDNIRTNLTQSVRESKMCIISVNNNHWICCFQYNNSRGQKVWAKIDSLSSNIVSNLGQDPDGTSKTPIDISSRYPDGSLSEIMFIKSKLDWR